MSKKMYVNLLQKCSNSGYCLRTYLHIKDFLQRCFPCNIIFLCQINHYYKNKINLVIIYVYIKIVVKNVLNQHILYRLSGTIL